jgi:mycothiol system anti-sigma-R factor
MTPLSNPFMLADGTKPNCVEMLQLILDGEANAEQQHYFKNHMDKCMPCFRSYSLDMSIKELLRSRCCGDPVPPGLVDQIKMQIGQHTSS